MQRRGQIPFACLAAGLVAVGDEPAPLERRFEHLPEGCEGPELGPERLERLLHGRCEDLAAPLGFVAPAFAVLGGDGHDFGHADLGRLLQEPLEAFGVLGRGHGHREAVGQAFVVGVGVFDLHRAAARVGGDDAAAVHGAPSVRYI